MFIIFFSKIQNIWKYKNNKMGSEIHNGDKEEI